MLGDRFAECLALPGVIHGIFERRLRQPDGDRADTDPPAVESGEGLVQSLALFPDQALEWVLASVGCFSLLLVLTLLKPGGLGMGDVKLGLLLGAGLGLDVATAVLLGCLALWPVALYVVLTADGPDARKRTLPLGPALALGAAIVALAG